MIFRKIIILLTNLIFWVNAGAQITINGTVRDLENNNIVVDANVMLLNKNNLGMYGYATTNSEGTFSITANIKSDSIVVMVTGINVRETRKTIAAHTQKIDIYVVSEQLKIREVVVKTRPIRRHGDTINYLVSKFSDQKDRSIGDVLKKMPGIDVSQSGQITYNGRAINKFYIENMDLLEGRYGVAVNNVQAKDIATVQVLEDHQPKKILQDVVKSNEAAINLKLKNDAKGTFNATLQLGGGYTPAMWNSEIVTMYFSRKVQTMNTYKTNNSGNDVSQEFTWQYFEDDDEEYYQIPYIKIYTPLQPDINRKRFLRNDIHTLTLNTLFRTSKDVDVKTNVNYIHDRRKSCGNSTTSYFSPNKDIVIPEDVYARQRSDRIDFDFQYLKNTKAAYIKNQIKALTAWDKDFGSVHTGNDFVSQHFKSPQAGVGNNLTIMKVAGKYLLSFVLKNSISGTSNVLDVQPLLYENIFTVNKDYEGLRQKLEITKFKSHFSAFTSRNFENCSVSIKIGYDLNMEKMTSDLNPFDNNKTIKTTNDSLHNNLRRNELKLFAVPCLNINNIGRFSAEINFPVSFLAQHYNDKIMDKKNDRGLFFIEPNANFSYKLNINTRLSAGAGLSQNNGGIYDIYSGYIMNYYRYIGNNVGRLDKNIYQTYNISLSYGNAITSIFGSANVMYYKNTSEIFKNINYSGILAQSTSYERNNSHDGYIISGKISKRYDRVTSSVGLFCSYRKSFNDLLRQEKLIKYVSDYLNFGISASTNFCKFFRFDYNISYGYNNGRIRNGAKYDIIKAINQNAVVALFISSKLIVSFSGEHLYNNAISGSSRSMFFADAYLMYRTKRVDYSVEANNMTNEKYYKSALYNDVSGYIYSYKLRPISFLFKIKFSLR